MPSYPSFWTFELYFSSWSCTHYFNNRITTSMWKSPNIKAHYLLTAMFQKIKYYMEHKNDSIQCSHLVWMFEIWRKKNGAEFQVDVFIMQENNARSLGWINLNMLWWHDNLLENCWRRWWTLRKTGTWLEHLEVLAQTAPGAIGTTTGQFQ